MSNSRSSGILLHTTSLPGRFGVGDAGPEAIRFLDRLASASQSIWQILPLGPTGFGNSPYQSLSAFALNPLLVSPERLADAGFLEAGDLLRAERPSTSRVDFADVSAERRSLLRRAFARFRAGSCEEPSAVRVRFEEFRARHEGWLSDFAHFVVIKDAQGGRAWTEWPRELRLREGEALRHVLEDGSEAIEQTEFAQFLAFTHWEEVRNHARTRGVTILGDVPIFVAADSADVWAHRELFDLDDEGRPRVVAGVPPDYFSKTGQLWGNPLYRWEALADQRYAWWIARMRAAFEVADRVRIDHFRGFESYWEIPAGESTAIPGRWKPGPGRAIFDALSESLGSLSIVAEDLGEITPEVHALRDELGFPGMRILQFGFSTAPREDLHAPHNFPRHCVAYTGTHDNDTTVGWFRSGPGSSTRTADDVAAEKERVLKYLGTTGEQIHWDMIRLLLLSVADTAIVPMQDVLGLGASARMNTPGRADGNWDWRLEGKSHEGDSGESTVDAAMERLAELSRIYGRVSATPKLS